jgi:hypothetical protein
MGWSVTQRFGLTHHRPQRTAKGYTLVIPSSGDSCYLVDMDGRFVHRWSFEGFTPHKAELLDNGNLLVMGLEHSLRPAGPAPEVGAPPEPFEARIRRLGANSSLLLEVDWDGAEIWRHQDIAMHHDFKRLPNGNTLFPVWVEMPEQLTKAVRGGTRVPREKLPACLLGDDLVEVDPTGKEVRRVQTWNLYDPRKDPICPLEGRIEWTHVNSVDVNAEGEIAISCRNNSRVSVISPEGALTWNYGAPDTAHQHHATFVDGGRIQIFDNGMHRLRGMSTSKVIEVDRATNEVTWSYQGDPPAQFFSGHISGATRLPNQNTLVCEGTSGRVFEVTRGGEVVWEWWNPVYNTRPNGDTMGWLFRAYRYAPDHPALAGRDLDPERLADLNRLYQLA